MDINGQKIILEAPKASYKFTLLRASLEKKQDGFLKEKFTLLKRNVVTEVIEGVPSITFFDHVKEYIQRRIAKMIIVKLLGGVRLVLMHY